MTTPGVWALNIAEGLFDGRGCIVRALYEKRNNLSKPCDSTSESAYRMLPGKTCHLVREGPDFSIARFPYRCNKAICTKRSQCEFRSYIPCEVVNADVANFKYYSKRALPSYGELVPSIVCLAKDNNELIASTAACTTSSSRFEVERFGRIVQDGECFSSDPSSSSSSSLFFETCDQSNAAQTWRRFALCQLTTREQSPPMKLESSSYSGKCLAAPRRQGIITEVSSYYIKLYFLGGSGDRYISDNVTLYLRRGSSMTPLHNLQGTRIPPDGFFVLCDSSSDNNCDATLDTQGLSALASRQSNGYELILVVMDETSLEFVDVDTLPSNEGGSVVIRRSSVDAPSSNSAGEWDNLSGGTTTRSWDGAIFDPDKDDLLITAVSKGASVSTVELYSPNGAGKVIDASENLVLHIWYGNDDEEDVESYSVAITNALVSPQDWQNGRINVQLGEQFDTSNGLTIAIAANPDCPDDLELIDVFGFISEQSLLEGRSDGTFGWYRKGNPTPTTFFDKDLDWAKNTEGFSLDQPDMQCDNNVMHQGYHAYEDCSIASDNIPLFQYSYISKKFHPSTNADMCLARHSLFSNLVDIRRCDEGSQDTVWTLAGPENNVLKHFELGGPSSNGGACIERRASPEQCGYNTVLEGCDQNSLDPRNGWKMYGRGGDAIELAVKPSAAVEEITDPDLLFDLFITSDFGALARELMAAVERLNCYILRLKGVLSDIGRNAIGVLAILDSFQEPLSIFRETLEDGSSTSKALGLVCKILERVQYVGQGKFVFLFSIVPTNTPHPHPPDPNQCSLLSLLPYPLLFVCSNQSHTAYFRSRQEWKGYEGSQQKN